MNLSQAFTFEPKLTLDGIMTLSAGVIAFVAVVLQIRSARKDVNLQLDAERKTRTLESERQMQAVARALQFEIVNFYKYYRAHLLPLLDNVDIESCQPPSFSAPDSDFFAIYKGSVSHIGSFEEVLVGKVVRSYGLSASLLSSIREYTFSLQRELDRQHYVAPASAPRKLLKQIRNLMYETDAAAVEAMQALCKVTALPFDNLEITR